MQKSRSTHQPLIVSLPLLNSPLNRSKTIMLNSVKIPSLKINHFQSNEISELDTSADLENEFMQFTSREIRSVRFVKQVKMANLQAEKLAVRVDQISSRSEVTDRMMMDLFQNVLGIRKSLSNQ